MLRLIGLAGVVLMMGTAAQAGPDWTLPGAASDPIGYGEITGADVMAGAKRCAEAVKADDRGLLSDLPLLSEEEWGKTTDRAVYDLPQEGLTIRMMLSARKARKLKIQGCSVELDAAAPQAAREAAMEVALAWAEENRKAGVMTHDPCEGSCAKHMAETGGRMEDYFWCAAPGSPLKVSPGWFNAEDTFHISLSRFSVLGKWRKACP
ncbi:hypothetical protein ACQ5SO_21305 [Rhodovulum sp. DZ06]|uniref:hypothetical protein n=1 Tax=Rhodovulum sp. DZ06 TaxID=3425126 RepID=UPI003D341A5C